LPPQLFVNDLVDLDLALQPLDFFKEFVLLDLLLLQDIVGSNFDLLVQPLDLISELILDLPLLLHEFGNSHFGDLLKLFEEVSDEIFILWIVHFTLKVINHELVLLLLFLQ
jgi:hypothetical protein